MGVSGLEDRIKTDIVVEDAQGFVGSEMGAESRACERISLVEYRDGNDRERIKRWRREKVFAVESRTWLIISLRGDRDPSYQERMQRW